MKRLLYLLQPPLGRQHITPGGAFKNLKVALVSPPGERFFSLAGAEYVLQEKARTHRLKEVLRVLS